MEYSPPPLFKQGASARAKVVIFSMVAIALLVVDARWQTLGVIRQVVGTVLYPLQRVALMPRDAAYAVGDYFSSLSRVEEENRRFMRQQLSNAQALQQSAMLAAENAQLRKLLAASERLPVQSLMAEILYDARDPFTRKIVLDRGSQQGVKPGQPVIDDTGVVGQVTRVFPFTSETTLLTDKDQSIPVQVVRSGLRSVAYGRGQSGVLDLRFMPANADIRKGDMLVTSGLDGIYPAGLSVAQVTQVEHKSSDAFAKIVCQPAAGIDRNRQLLILLTEYQPPQRLQPAVPVGAEAKAGDKTSGKPAGNAAAKPDGTAAAKPDAKTDAKPNAKPADKLPPKPEARGAAQQGSVPQSGAPAAKPAASAIPAATAQKTAKAGTPGASTAPTPDKAAPRTAHASSTNPAAKPAIQSVAKPAPAMPAPKHAAQAAPIPAAKPAQSVAPVAPASRPAAPQPGGDASSSSAAKTSAPVEHQP